MKKAFALLLTLSLLCAFAPSAKAAPEDMISIYAQATLSGNVMMLHVQIRNSEENLNPLQNIRVMTNSGVIFSFESIEPGGMDMSTGAYYGSYEQDGSIRIAILWNDGGAEYSRNYWCLPRVPARRSCSPFPSSAFSRIRKSRWVSRSR
jgi:hypothetical protein